MTGSKIAIASGILLVLLMFGGSLQGQSVQNTTKSNYSRRVTPTWQPGPGSDPVRYEVEIRIGGEGSENITTEETPVAEIALDVEPLTSIAIRVRGIDAAGLIGPWSEWSDDYEWDIDDPPPLD